MKRALDGVYWVAKTLMTLLLAVLIVPVTMQILARYTDLIPRYIWTEEIARFCFIWVIMLGAMIAVRDETHFDVDLLPHSASKRMEGVAKLVVHLAMLFTALCFVYYGKYFADRGLLQTSEIAELPMIAIYIAWPLAGVVWTLFLLEKLIDDIRLIGGRT